MHVSKAPEVTFWLYNDLLLVAPSLQYIWCFLCQRCPVLAWSIIQIYSDYFDNQILFIAIMHIYVMLEVWNHLKNICNGCGMPTEDAYSSGHLVLSHFGTCMCSNVETNLSWTCLVSGLLNFEHPSVLLFSFFNIQCNFKKVKKKKKKKTRKIFQRKQYENGWILIGSLRNVFGMIMTL